MREIRKNQKLRRGTHRTVQKTIVPSIKKDIKHVEIHMVYKHMLGTFAGTLKVNKIIQLKQNTGEKKNPLLSFSVSVQTVFA